MTPGLVDVARQATSHLSVAAVAQLFPEPIIILSSPRSGSGMLFERLLNLAGLWSLGAESSGIFAAFPKLGLENSNCDSGRLLAGHADAETADNFRRCFAYLVRDHRGQPWIKLPADSRPAALTLLEKTPRNALNVEFLLQVFPDARFIYLHRDARAVIASLVEAWELGLRSGRFVTYRNLPGWDRPAWCFLLPPGWREMTGRSLFDIAAFQWAASNDAIVRALAALTPDRYMTVSYDALVATADDTTASLCKFSGISEPPEPQALTLSATTVSQPSRDKWRRYEREIEAVTAQFGDAESRVQAFLAHRATPS